MKYLFVTILALFNITTFAAEPPKATTGTTSVTGKKKAKHVKHVKHLPKKYVNKKTKNKQ